MLKCSCGLYITRRDKFVSNAVIDFIEQYKGNDLKNDLLKCLRNTKSDENLDLEMCLCLVENIK